MLEDGFVGFQDFLMENRPIDAEFSFYEQCTQQKNKLLWRELRKKSSKV
jgi:hypothetical protein